MLLTALFCDKTADIKYIRDMLDLWAVSTVDDGRLHGFLRKYRGCFSWEYIIAHAIECLCLISAFYCYH